jgi:threonine dehydratase
VAAATLACAVDWPVRVFVPPEADSIVVGRLRELGAQVSFCSRTDGAGPGDPCVHRFREAVDGGAVPFSVQGPENGLCLDTGRTIGWELQSAGLDALVVQVGGGALAACLAAGDPKPRLFAIQTEGCAPLLGAWARAGQLGGTSAAVGRWREVMRPWASTPRSAASGLLDDEVYDWVGVLSGVERSGGGVSTVDEAGLASAVDLAGRTTGVAVDATGAAGLAGVLSLREAGTLRASDRVGVLFTGAGFGPHR